MSSFYVILAALSAFWVYQDGQRRGMSSLWAIGTFFAPFIFLLLYLIFRKPEKYITEEEEIVRVCYRCDKKICEGDRFCSNCGTDTQNTKCDR
jgi:hypothetical protein